MKKYGRCKRVLFLCLSLLLIVSLSACKETDEQNSAQPTPSTQPTAAPPQPLKIGQFCISSAVWWFCRIETPPHPADTATSHPGE